MTNPFHHFLVPLVLLAVIWIAATKGSAGTVHLRGQAEVLGPEVRLDDVADLEDMAETIGQIVVGRLGAGADYTVVSLASVRSSLDQSPISLGVVSLGGYARCRVQRRDTHAPERTAQTGAPLVANSIEQVGLRSDITLRDHLIRFLAQRAGAVGGELVVRISNRDAEILSAATAIDEQEFQVKGHATLGKLLVQIHRRGQFIQQDVVRPIVMRRTLAVVAKQKIRRGGVLTAESLEIREVLLDHDREPVIQRLRDVLGKVAKTTLAPDVPLNQHDLRLPYMVRKGDLVGVRCIFGSLIVETTGLAKDDGSVGDIIKVENERSVRMARDQGHRRTVATIHVRVTGPRQTVTQKTWPSDREHAPAGP